METIVTTNTSSTIETGSHARDAQHTFRAAYEATAAAREALAIEALLPINLDVPLTTATILSNLPGLKELRAQAAASAIPFDLTPIDNLETYVRALAHAQTAYLAGSTPVEPFPELAARAATLRETFLIDARSLEHRGLIDGDRLKQITGGNGYLNTAADLGVLVQLFRERWDAISANCPIRPAELDEAEDLYERLVSTYGERTRNTRAASAALERQRAFTLVVTTYDAIRRMATFLRWNSNDVDTLVPSLWAGRSGRRRDRATPPPPVVAPVAAVVPSASTGTRAPIGSSVPLDEPDVDG